MTSPRTRLVLPIAAAGVVLVGTLTAVLYAEASRRMAALGGAELEDVLAPLGRSFVLLAGSTCLLLVAFVAWQAGRALPPAAETPIEPRSPALDAALEREREFTGHVAHELRTPLTVLNTGIELILRKQSPGSEAHFSLLELLGTVEEMRRVVDNLLLLARVERGADTTQLLPVAVRPLVDAVWRRLEEKAKGRGLHFDNRVPEDHRVAGDRGKLHLVIQNLLANAVSYTEQNGSIVVEGGADEPLSVWDSGPQIPRENLDRVFDRLWRADLARTDATQHAGLGLSLARALCRHMAMEVAAENVATGGLRFVVTPAART